MNKLRVAVVGLSHGRNHINNVLQHPKTRLAALVDLDGARLAEQYERNREYDPHVFGCVQQMAQSGVADVAVIAVPTACHTTTSEICLGAGLHVLLEKPLCRTDEESERIRAAVESSGKVLQVGYEVRSSPLHRNIMEHIVRGDLGEVTNVWWHQHTLQSPARYADWRQERANMGGALFDCAPHFLDIIGQWAGAPLHRVVALGNRKNEVGPCSETLPESVAISLEYSNGVRGTYNFGAVNDFNDDAHFGVAGTSGRITGNPVEAGHYELRRDKGACVEQVKFDPAVTSSGHLGFREQFDFFVSTVLDGAPNVCSFKDALQVHRTMRAIDQSLSTGKIVTLA